MPPLSDWQYRIKATSSGVVIEHGPDIGCYRVTSGADVQIGWLIGFPIDLGKGELIEGPFAIETAEDASPSDIADTIFERVGGQFLWVMDDDKVQRIYPDVAAQVPCVYDPDSQCAALAIPALWPSEMAQERFDEELYRHMRVDAEGWLPAGLTAHHGAYRLLPNHYLDLGTWEAVRFRGAEQLFAPTTLEETADTVGRFVRTQMDALRKSGRGIALSLTAGRDCRMVAAAASHLRDDVLFVTLIDEGGLNADTQIARRIADTLNLNHRELKRRFANDADREAYIARGGHCISGANARLFPSMAPLRKSHIFVGGLGGEHARGYMWNQNDDGTWPTAASLLRRFSFVPNPRVEERVKAWLDGIDAQSAKQVYEMAYLELREACWASAQFPCDPTLIRHQPMRTVPTIRAMLGLPDADKQNARLADVMMEQGWPELAEFPINSLGKTGDFLARMRRVLRDPEAVVRRLRRLRS